MNRTGEFLAFMNLYWAVMQSPLLSLAEQTAAIEVAADEFLQRVAAPAYHAIVKRLAALPPKETHASSEVPTQPTPTQKKAGRAGRVAPGVRG